jgi:CBS domain-containing protein
VEVAIVKIRDIMTTTVVTVRPETPLKDVAELLLERRISGVPVVDELGVVLGVVSEADFVTKEAGVDAHRSSWVSWLTGATPEARREEALVAARTAGEAMTTPVVSIGSERPLSEAAHRMAEYRVNRLPVVDGGMLVGIVTRADVVRAYARSDEDLRRAAVDALHAVDGLDVVGVKDGVVRLSGSVASEALYQAVHKIVQHIDGVVAVDDREVSWIPSEPAVHIV